MMEQSRASSRDWLIQQAQIAQGLQVRFGSEADICGAKSDVCFHPNSDRESGHTLGSNRGLPSERDDARTPMTVAARTNHVAQGCPHRSFGVARLHPQVQIDEGPATDASDYEPVVLRGERRGNLGPGPRVASG